MKRLARFRSCLGLLLVCVACLSCTRAGGLRTLEGQPLTNLTLTPLPGSPPLRLEDLEDHVTLINFWGPWCPPCRQEFPHLVTLAREFRDEPAFRFVSVALSAELRGEDAAFVAETQRYLSDQRADFPVYLDPQLETRVALQRSAGTEGFGIPVTLLVDRRLTIRAVWQGYVPGVEKEIARRWREVHATSK